jgi:L-lactate dehydrogenase complex protein LldF
VVSSHESHPTLAKRFVADIDRAHWHDESLWFIREKRDLAAHGLPEWEELRERASQIKNHSVANLAKYLLQFEEKATALGVTVHWASDAKQHNQIVLGILQSHGVKRIVKSKSMLTEECHLNPFLEDHGMEVVDTDLGERIVQLRNEAPSHIVIPAIHIRKEEVGELFAEKLGTDPGATDPEYLTEAARQHLREKFLQADAGITGVNFAIAETGGIVVCTNEGNADLGVSMPKLHIACMGLEKIIPRVADLGVFLRLLARSATGQPITTYSSHFHGPIDGGELHVVLLDNGRANITQDDDFHEALNCIRCGACMNTCPVYRRTGGHSYSATVPGPIGSVLNPLKAPSEHASLPFACSLCGSCTDVCPVKIPLHHQLYQLRSELKLQGNIKTSKSLQMWFAGMLFRRPALYRLAGWTARWSVKLFGKVKSFRWLTIWGRQRDLPLAPQKTFRKWHNENRSTGRGGHG